MKQNQNLQKLKDKTFTLQLEIKVEDIKNEYQKQLKNVQANFENKGFRKGKAPLEVVEANISQEKLFEEVASHLISDAYGQAIKDNDLKPITQPQVKFKNEHPDFEHDWQIEITSCELPEIELDKKYLSEVAIINDNKLLTDDNQKMDQIIKNIVVNAKLELPKILIESDLQSHLSDLVNQASQAGITVQQYLESQKQTLEDYKENLRKKIIQEWTVNLSISKIAKDNKIEVSEAEIKDLLSKNPALSKNINMVYYLLTQQKVFEFLKKQTSVLK
jgi:FKBP-type peptidyl-prolyl cis-trans isomerase (trigger factor)